MKGFLSRHEVLGPADMLQYSSGIVSGTRNRNHLHVLPQNHHVWVFFPSMDCLGHFETLETPVNCLPSTLTPQTLLLLVVVVWLSNFYDRKTNSFK